MQQQQQQQQPAGPLPALPTAFWPPPPQATPITPQALQSYLAMMAPMPPTAAATVAPTAAAAAAAASSTAASASTSDSLRAPSAPSSDEPERRPWSQAEDLLVKQLVAQHGTKKWSVVGSALEGRTGKQCRERYMNHLRDNINKEVWMEAEDRLIIEGHKKMGTRWSEIAKTIAGRTDNAIKNRWNSTMRRVARQASNKTLGSGAATPLKSAAGKKGGMLGSEVFGATLNYLPLPEGGATPSSDAIAAVAAAVAAATAAASAGFTAVPPATAAASAPFPLADPESAVSSTGSSELLYHYCCEVIQRDPTVAHTLTLTPSKAILAATQAAAANGEVPAIAVPIRKKPGKPAAAVATTDAAAAVSADASKPVRKRKAPASDKKAAAVTATPSAAAKPRSATKGGRKAKAKAPVTGAAGGDDEDDDDYEEGRRGRGAAAATAAAATGKRATKKPRRASTAQKKKKQGESDDTADAATSRPTSALLSNPDHELESETDSDDGAESSEADFDSEDAEEEESLLKTPMVTPQKGRRKPVAATTPLATPLSSPTSVAASVAAAAAAATAAGAMEEDDEGEEEEHDLDVSHSSMVDIAVPSPAHGSSTQLALQGDIPISAAPSPHNLFSPSSSLPLHTPFTPSFAALTAAHTSASPHTTRSRARITAAIADPHLLASSRASASYTPSKVSMGTGSSTRTRRPSQHFSFSDVTQINSSGMGGDTPMSTRIDFAGLTGGGASTPVRGFKLGSVSPHGSSALAVPLQQSPPVTARNSHVAATAAASTAADDFLSSVLQSTPRPTTAITTAAPGTAAASPRAASKHVAPTLQPAVAAAATAAALPDTPTGPALPPTGSPSLALAAAPTSGDSSQTATASALPTAADDATAITTSPLSSPPNTQLRAHVSERNDAITH